MGCCRQSNLMGLEAAVEATVAFLDKAVKPVMVAGPKIHVAKAGDASVELAEASGSSVQLRCRERARPADVHACVEQVGSERIEDKESREFSANIH